MEAVAIDAATVGLTVPVELNFTVGDAAGEAVASRIAQCRRVEVGTVGIGGQGTANAAVPPG